MRWMGEWPFGKRGWDGRLIVSLSSLPKSIIFINSHYLLCRSSAQGKGEAQGRRKGEAQGHSWAGM